MPFRNAFKAEATAFDYGCGPHCLANAYILNLKNGKFQRPEELRSLHVLLLGFKAYYPGAQDLTVAELKDILINDLENPIHREIVLSRVLRNMIHPHNSPYRVPGVEIPDREVQKLANRLRMRAESFGSLEGLINEEYRNSVERSVAAELRKRGLANTPDNINAITKELTDKGALPTRERIRQEALMSPEVGPNYESRNLLPANDSGIPSTAPLLKLMNQHGGHWEWEYNIHADDARNLAEVQAYNLHYPNHPVNYGMLDQNHASIYAKDLHDRFNQALLNRRAIYARNQRLRNELNAYEAEVAQREGRRARLNQQSAPLGNSHSSTNASTSNNQSALPAGSGFIGLLGSLFNTMMPLFSAPTGTKAGSNTQTGVLVLQNFFGTLKNFFQPSENQPGIGGIVGLLFGWIGQLVGVFGKAAGMVEQMKEADPNRPLNETEKQTPEGALIAQYAEYLPEEASAVKAKLFADFHDAAVPRAQILSDLKTALQQYDLIEYQSLVFNQHVAKLDAPTQQNLRLQFNRSHGSPVAWKNLAHHLAMKGLFNEASEVLIQEENRLLKQGFLPGKAEASALAAALKDYEAILNQLQTEPTTANQYALRRDMIAAIEAGGKKGAEIQAKLRALYGEYAGLAGTAHMSGAKAGASSAADKGAKKAKASMADKAESGDKADVRHDAASALDAEFDDADFADKADEEAFDDADEEEYDESSERDWKKSFESVSEAYARESSAEASMPFTPGFAAHSARQSASSKFGRSDDQDNRDSRARPDFNPFEMPDLSSSRDDFDGLDPLLFDPFKRSGNSKVIFGNDKNGQRVSFDLM